MSRRVATNLERIQFHHGNLLSFIQSVSLQSVFFKKKRDLEVHGGGPGKGKGRGEKG